MTATVWVLKDSISRSYGCGEGVSEAEYAVSTVPIKMRASMEASLLQFIGLPHREPLSRHARLLGNAQPVGAQQAFNKPLAWLSPEARATGMCAGRRLKPEKSAADPRRRGQIG
jgi:hypothetical protein